MSRWPAAIVALGACCVIIGCSDQGGNAPLEGEELALVRTGERDDRDDVVLLTVGDELTWPVLGSSRGSQVPDVRPLPFGRVAWAPDGRRLAFAAAPRPGRTSRSDLYFASIEDRTVWRLTASGDAASPVVSPDGSLIAFARGEGAPQNGGPGEPRSSIWLMDSDGGNVVPFGSAGAAGDLDRPSAFSPDGSALLFTRSGGSSETPPKQEVHRALLDGSRSDVLIGDGAEAVYSPDGERLAFVSSRDANGELCYAELCLTANELYVADADGSDARRLTHTHAQNEDAPAFSPDGRLIAFQRGSVVDNAQGTGVYVIEADGEGERRLAEQRKLREWYASPAWRP